MKKSISMILLFAFALIIGVSFWSDWKLNASSGSTAAAEVKTPNVKTADYVVQNGVKVFNLIAEPVKQEVSKGLFVNAWGYNGGTPGPAIVVTQGDRVKVNVTNNLPEATSVHWHGLIVPNDMDGVTGVEPGTEIKPGQSYTYEFTVKQAGTFMYHSHVQPSKQEMMGLDGLFIALPNAETASKQAKVDRDYAILLQEWQLQDAGMTMSGMGGMEMSSYREGQVPPGTYDVNPTGMNWNTFTFNGKQFPATEVMEIKKGERVRVRLGNLSMQNHPIHLHGHDFTVVAKDGSRLPVTQQYLANTIDIAPGETYDIEFTADNPGSWVIHCHLPHHTAGMNGSEGGMLSVFHYEGTPLAPALQSVQNQANLPNKPELKMNMDHSSMNDMTMDK